MKTILIVIGTILVLGLLWLCFIVPFVGWHIVTSNGEHTGYVTALEQNGLFFKTWRAYVKTDTQSSQEDEYCVVNQDVVNQLKQAVDSKEHVTVSYIDWFSKGIANCGAEKGGVITGVRAITN